MVLIEVPAECFLESIQVSFVKGLGRRSAGKGAGRTSLFFSRTFKKVVVLGDAFVA